MSCADRFCGTMLDLMGKWTTRSRFRGCLLGLAVGDALGTTLEFRSPGSFEPISEMVGGGPFGLEPGQWTDDTSMALCLAESLIETGSFDARDQAQRYVRWWREGHLSSNGRCFDIGGTVSQALNSFERTGEPLSGSIGTYSAGNGSIMRLAPIPMRYSGNQGDLDRFAADSSRVTHGAPECIDACRYMSGIVAGLLDGESKENVLSPRYRNASQTWGLGCLAPAIDEIAQGSFKTREPPEIEGSGYVVRSLEAALWAFHRTGNFRDGALLAVNLGDDADTTGAVYGQIAGACYGDGGIPSSWRTLVIFHEKIIEFADRLFEMVSSSDWCLDTGTVTDET